jgi:hypothetical protein
MEALRLLGFRVSGWLVRRSPFRPARSPFLLTRVGGNRNTFPEEQSAPLAHPLYSFLVKLNLGKLQLVYPYTMHPCNLHPCVCHTCKPWGW